MRTYEDQLLTHLDELIQMVKDENFRQIQKWGVQSHLAFLWYTVLGEEVGELAQAILNFEIGGEDRGNVTKEAMQVATLALKIAEMYSFKQGGSDEGEIKDTKNN